MGKDYTKIWCEDCGEAKDMKIQLGIVDYDHDHYSICFDCLTKAYNLMKEKQ